MISIGQLESVNPKEVWDLEPNFSKWLAEEPNLQKLGDLLDIDINFIELESYVGSQRVDIFAEESGTGKKIVIENQYGDSNHDHLGKIITYAAGKCASYVIWIVENARNEYRRAVEWLNEMSSVEVNFFLVELKVVKIGDSLPAPMFNIVEKPDDWVKHVNQSTQEITQSGKVCLDFWTKFSTYANKDKIFRQNFKLRRPHPHRWFDLAIGIRNVNIAMNIQPTQNGVDTGLYFSDNREHYQKLVDKAEEVEKIIGEKIIWHEANKATRIIIKHSVNFDDEKQVQECFDWFIALAPKLKKVAYLVK